MCDAAGGNLNQPEPDGKQRKQAAGVVAAALAAGETVKRAAGLGHVSERTVYNWLRKPAFKRRVNEVREQAVSAAVGLLSSNMTAAATALVKLLKSRSEAIRLRAARSVLELTADFRDLEEIQERIEELERQLGVGRKR